MIVRVAAHGEARPTGGIMRIVAALVIAGLVGACDTPNFRTAQFRFGTAETLSATGNLRFVMERQRPLGDGTSQTVVCSEPSPDYAVASATDADLSVKTTVPSGPTVDAQAGVQTTETVTQGAGRDKAVLALRDGLYAACQAYVNGAIGKDAYSVILSQYGNLLVALLSSGPERSAAQHNSARAALLVACISGNDPTRGIEGTRGSQNPVLTPAFCRNLLTQVSRTAVR